MQGALEFGGVYVNPPHGFRGIYVCETRVPSIQQPTPPMLVDHFHRRSLVHVPPAHIPYRSRIYADQSCTDAPHSRSTDSRSREGETVANVLSGFFSAACITSSTVLAPRHRSGRTEETLPSLYDEFPSGATTTSFASVTPSSCSATILSASSRLRMSW